MALLQGAAAATSLPRIGRMTGLAVGFSLTVSCEGIAGLDGDYGATPEQRGAFPGPAESGAGTEVGGASTRNPAGAGAGRRASAGDPGMSGGAGGRETSRHEAGGTQSGTAGAQDVPGNGGRPNVSGGAKGSATGSSTNNAGGSSGNGPVCNAGSPPSTSAEWDFTISGTADHVVQKSSSRLNGILNVYAGCGFGDGAYTLMSYTGALLNGRLVAGTLPSGTTSDLGLDPGTRTLTYAATTPFAQWKLNESSGTTIADSSGRNPGVLAGTLSSVQGRYDASALSFDGSTRITGSLTGARALDQPLTISFWYRSLRAPASTETLVSLANATSGQATECGVTASGLGCWASGGAPLVVAPLSPPGQWHHLAYTYDGSNNRLYLDGQQVAASTTVPPAEVPTRFQLSGRDPADCAGAGCSTGYLDEVRLYQSALAPALIKAMALPLGTQLFADDFDDNAIDPAFWTQNSGSVPAQVTSGQLTASPPPNTTCYGDCIGSYPGLYQGTPMDFTDRMISVEVTQVLADSTSGETELCLGDGNGNELLISVSGSDIAFRYWISGSDYGTRIAYDPVAHRFWRLRHNAIGSLVYWETSPDGKSWTVQHSLPTPFPVTALTAFVGAGVWSPTTHPGTAIFDNLRVQQ